MLTTTQKCSRCGIQATREMEVTNQSVCTECFRNKDYYDPFRAKKVFITIKLFGYRCYETPSTSVVLTATTHSLLKGDRPKYKEVLWDQIDWNIFSALFEPGVLAIIGKLVERKIPISRRYNPDKAEDGYTWMCKVGNDYTAAVAYGSTEATAVIDAVYQFLKYIKI